METGWNQECGCKINLKNNLLEQLRFESEISYFSSISNFMCTVTGGTMDSLSVVRFGDFWRGDYAVIILK